MKTNITGIEEGDFREYDVCKENVEGQLRFMQSFQNPRNSKKSGFVPFEKGPMRDIFVS